MGRKHGVATESWKDGSSYMGEYFNGRMQGYGTMTWKRAGKSDKVYAGMWLDSKQHGVGTMSSNGVSQYREYKNGIKVFIKSLDDLNKEKLDWVKQLADAKANMGKKVVCLKTFLKDKEDKEKEALMKKKDDAMP